MTRDEAVEKVQSMTGRLDSWCEDLVASLATLGLIKFEEPEDVYIKASQALAVLGTRCNAVALKDILESANLRVVPA